MEEYIVIPGISVLAIAGLIFVSKNFILEFIKNAIKYDYDEKIEKLKAEIKSNESDILALRSGALSSITEKQKLLYAKQVEATEKLWQHIVSIMPAKNVSAMMQNISYDEWAKKSQYDTELRRIFGQIGDNLFKLEDFNKSDAIQLRPFLSPMLWAYFQAYRAILAHDLIKINLIKMGHHIPKIDDNGHLIKLLHAALPEYQEIIDKYKTLSCYSYLEILENKIVEEIQNTLDGIEADKLSVQKANTILKEVQKVQEQNSQVNQTIDDNSELSV